MIARPEHDVKLLTIQFITLHNDVLPDWPMTKQQLALYLDEKQAEFVMNAVCGVPDDQREDNDEEVLEYLLDNLNRILQRFSPD